jgi:hypothetical protein
LSRFQRVIAVGCLWSFAAVAQVPPRLASAIKQFDEGALADAQRSLAALVQDGVLKDEWQVVALSYLAAAHLERGDSAGARLQLEHLFLINSGARLDPAVFSPELVALAARVRRERGASPPTAEAPRVAVAPSEPESPGVSLKWVPAAAGGAAIIAAAVLYAMNRSIYDRVRTADASIKDESAARAAIGQGRTLQTSAFIVGGIGIAAMLTSAGLYLFGSSSAPAVGVTVDGAGGAVSWSGTWE